MTREEAIAYFKRHIDLYCVEGISKESEEMAIKALEQEPCEDTISRQAVIDATVKKNSIWNNITNSKGENLEEIISQLPPVTLQPKMGYCKECKYFEYDSMAKINGIPLIVAHEICKKWGDGCQTKEDGYCFLFEPKESEEKK